LRSGSFQRGPGGGRRSAVGRLCAGGLGGGRVGGRRVGSRRVGGRRSAAGVCCGGRLRAGGLTRRPAAARGCGAAGSLTARGTRGTGHRFSGGTRLGGAAHGAAAAGQQQHCSTYRNRPRSPAVDHGQTIGQFTAPHRKSGLVGVGIRRPVSRVLCSGEFVAGVAAIHLGVPLPARSSDPPADSGGPPSDVCAHPDGPDVLDLAPGGVYRATPVTRGAGGLLHHRFTLTAGSGEARRRFVLCGTVPRLAPGCR